MVNILTQVLLYICVCIEKLRSLSTVTPSLISWQCSMSMLYWSVILFFQYIIDARPRARSAGIPVMSPHHATAATKTHNNTLSNTASVWQENNMMYCFSMARKY